MSRPAMKRRLENLIQENPMTVTHYIGFDVHKKSVNFCIKTADGEIVEEGTNLAQRDALRQWAMQRKHPWRGAMDATLFMRSTEFPFRRKASQRRYHVLCRLESICSIP